MEDYPKIKLDYAKDLEIDEHNLELEWLAIPRQIMAYSEAHVQAQFDRDRAKQRRDVVEADLDRAARSDPLPEDIPISAKTGQPTEASVLNWIHKQPAYQEAQKARQEAEYVVNLLQAAVFAFQAKKVALENLVRLFGMKYYAEPYDQPGSNTRQAGLDRAKYAGLEKLKGAMPGKSPEVKDTPPAPCKPPAPVQASSRGKDGHRWAIGPITEHGQHAFVAGPFPELQGALDWPGETGQGIYKLTREQPDELTHVWNNDNWEPVGKAPKTVPAPPKPPQRPLPRKPQ